MSRYDLVQTDKLVAPSDSGGGASGDLSVTASGFAARSDLAAQNLSTSVSGGTTPYSYAWSCIRPDGSSSTSEFDATNAATAQFTPARVGLYAVTCTVTDAAGSPLSAAATQSKTVGTALSGSLSGLANATDLSQQRV